MEVNASNIVAEVYHADDKRERYFVKITFKGTGMYINSFTVQPSKYENQPYWVQPPKHPQGKGQWVSTVDFEKNCELWQIIEHNAREAVKRYQEKEQGRVLSKVSDNANLDDDEPIDLSDIPF